MRHGVEKGGAGFLFFVTALLGQRFRLIVALFLVNPHAHIGIDIQQHIDAGCHRAGGIQAVDKFREFLAGLRSLLGSRFRHLVACGIHDDAGMIPGGFHHCRQVLLPLVFKPTGIVVVGLGDIPAIEGLIHHIHTQLIADIQCDLGSRVVSDPQGIEAVFLQDADAPLLSIRELTSTQYAVVVVNAAAAEQHTLPVDQQARFGAPLQLADTEGNTPLVFFRLNNTGV